MSRRRDKRATIVVDTDEARVVDEALDALGSDAGLYSRGHPAHLARVVSSRRPGAPVVAELSTAALRDRLTRCARFVRLGAEVPDPKTGGACQKMRAAHPPEWCVASLAARAEYPKLRDLVGVVTTPTLRPDGTILDQPGYDAETGLLYAPAGKSLRIPTQPSLAAAERARDELLEVVCDFPFATAAHRSAWLAGVLTLVARHAIEGNVPMVTIDANVAGSGKGLLADTIAHIATGAPLARKPQPGSDEEMRKFILAVAIAGTPAVLLDNCTGKVSYRSLDAALTCEGRWEDRVLGKSESRTLPLRTVWLLTANNAALGYDLMRRALPIRLASDHEHPEDRTDVKHRDLLAWLRHERGRLVRAALTCLRAYHVAGAPERDIVPWGSYAAWSRLIRQTVVWLGLPDPIEARHDLRERADVDREAIVAIYDALARFGGGSAATLRTFAERDDDLRAALVELAGGGDELPNSRRIGTLLRSLAGRVIAGRRLERAGTAHGHTTRWRITTLPGPVTSPTAPISPGTPSDGGGYGGDGGCLEPGGTADHRPCGAGRCYRCGADLPADVDLCGDCWEPHDDAEVAS